MQVHRKFRSYSVHAAPLAKCHTGHGVALPGCGGGLGLGVGLAGCQFLCAGKYIAPRDYIGVRSI